MDGYQPSGRFIDLEPRNDGVVSFGNERVNFALTTVPSAFTALNPAMQSSVIESLQFGK